MIFQCGARCVVALFEGGVGFVYCLSGTDGFRKRGPGVVSNLRGALQVLGRNGARTKLSFKLFG